MQIVGDFSTSEARARQMLFLQIDCLLRMAELGKHAQDYASAQEDFKKVIALCEQYPEKNEDTLTSALFNLGKLKLDIS